MPPADESRSDRNNRRKEELRLIRERAAKLLQSGVHGTQIAAMISDALDDFVVAIHEEVLAEFNIEERELIRAGSALLTVGGSGRGEVAPFSDLDLVLLYQPHLAGLMDRLSKRMVPEFWDAGIKLGQRVFTIKECLANALVDPHLASSLVYIRNLWGNDDLATHLRQKFYRKVVRRRRRAFIEDCIKGRGDERIEVGATGQQLEPDVKRSLGSLRDLHLLQWVAFARYESASIDDLRACEALTPEDAALLKAAVDFITKVRIDLHLHANKPNDTLSKDEQLRIANSRSYENLVAQRPVERFMQEYFMHSSAIEDISRRFVARHRLRSLGSVLQHALLTSRVGRYYLLSPEELDIRRSALGKMCRSLEDIMRIFHTAAMYRVGLAPAVIDRIKHVAQTLSPEPTPVVGELFLEILGANGRMAATLRAMHETNVLELIIPEWKRVRCLLQFNQYHHYTVDEHTLLCLQICEDYATEESAVGEVYRDLKVKPLLHLALLLHDAGKGYVEEHCEVGRRLALDVCSRFNMPSSQAEIVSFLIHRHLEMADLAFRHDITDPRILLEFSHKLGTPEKLSMLYVLTAADVSGVGPGVWNRWKGDLLGEFYDRLNFIVSGQQPKFQEEERLRQVREHVLHSIVPLGEEADVEPLAHWVDEQLKSFSSYYISMTPPQRIAADLDIIRGLAPGEIRVEGKYNPESQWVEYRVILDSQHSDGCFHRIAGTLTARHMDILGAEITTSTGGIVVDVFYVFDQDYSGEVPTHRIQEVGDAIRSVLTKKTTVKDLFIRHKRFASSRVKTPIMQLENRVVIDNDTSDRCTVVSVFAHDRPGLLYTISRTLFQLELSVDLAKIATHFDQVVDVFYVTDNAGQKILGENRLQEIQQRMLGALLEFEQTKHKEFLA